MIYGLWNSLRTPLRQGTALLAITATSTYSGRGRTIQPGDTVLYSAPKPEVFEQIHGRMVAVSDGAQIVFGEAQIAGREVIVNGQTYPRHMIRGIIFAVMKQINKA
jgi:hypothetical protein